VKLNEELETQKLNLRDINEFLTNELKARSLTTSAMEAKVVELYHLLDDLNKNHEVKSSFILNIDKQEWNLDQTCCDCAQCV
jgi:hypothetical protein